MTRLGADELTRRLHDGSSIKAQRVLVDMHEEKMLVEFDAQGREDLEKRLATQKFNFDWLLRIELESSASGFQPLP